MTERKIKIWINVLRVPLFIETVFIATAIISWSSLVCAMALEGCRGGGSCAGKIVICASTCITGGLLCVAMGLLLDKIGKKEIGRKLGLGGGVLLLLYVILHVSSVVSDFKARASFGLSWYSPSIYFPLGAMVVGLILGIILILFFSLPDVKKFYAIKPKA